VSRWVQAVQVLNGAPARVYGRPVGAVADPDGGVLVLLETGDNAAGDPHEVWIVGPHHTVPGRGQCLGVVFAGGPLAVYAARAR